ncbi:MAG: transcription termination factor Rho [Nitriliruptorales bacterium]|nr:transcription termination factor Rho [Nitriliruptorales bacterium]
MDRSGLEGKALAELREIAGAMELRGYQRMRKADLVDLIISEGNGSAPSTSNGDKSGAATSDAGSDDKTDKSAASDDATPKADETSEGSKKAEDAADADATKAKASEDKSESDGGSTNDGERTRERNRQRSREDDSGDRDHGDRNDNDGNQGQGQGRRRRNRNRKNRGGGGGGQGQGQGQQGGGQQHENLDDAEVREGILDLLPEGYGFLRVTGYLTGDKDVYVSQSFVRRHNLRRGDRLAGPIRAHRNNDKFPALGRVDTIEGEPVKDNRGKRADFKDMTPLFPEERLRLEIEGESPISMRIVDMMAPIGKGQRGLIVSPPKAGKTTILKQLAHAIETNNPEVHLMVALVDERPEEVTDFERSMTRGEVIASTFDRPADDHTQVAELTSERAKRLVEQGRDVVILLDSITRLGRAYNLAAPASGRILSGGIDSAALYPPKRFFGAARNIEGGGSLTIIATALIETGSKMDEVIFEEFKGTGNMELRLDRKMEQKRIFPAIDIQASGTRREELLLDPNELETIWKLRRLFSTMESGAALELLIDKLRATKSNSQFLAAIAKSNLGA